MATPVLLSLSAVLGDFRTIFTTPSVLHWTLSPAETFIIQQILVRERFGESQVNIKCLEFRSYTLSLYWDNDEWQLIEKKKSIKRFLIHVALNSERSLFSSLFYYPRKSQQVYCYRDTLQNTLQDLPEY